MSKMLKCLFCKRKEKNKGQCGKREERVLVTTETNPREVYENYKKMNAKNIRPTYVRRTSESLSRDPAYLDRLFGTNKKAKSYPVSPERNPRESGYLTDQKNNDFSDKKKNPYKRNSQLVYVAGLPPVASYFNAKEEESQEPFPYEIPEDPVPRRSTLFYDMQHGVQDRNQNSLYAAEKPIEDYELPSTSDRKSNVKQDRESMMGQRHVTINIPSEEVEKEHENIVRKTVVRFRPHSSGSCTLRESVKFMSLRASDVNRPSQYPGRYVHQIPLKPSKHTPPLMTIDGKPLKPLVADKIRRPSVISEKEIQSVRISVVEPLSDDINNFQNNSPKDPVNTTPVVRRSVMPANRNSMGHRRSVERRLSSVMRDGASPHHVSEVAEEQFPYKQQDEPLVYAVPTIPSRGCSRSVLQQSVKTLTSRHSRDEPHIHRKNIRYSVDTDVFSAETRQRSVAPSEPGYVNMERGQPMLVSEVLNPITSLFVTNLKDPVPKDPLTRPKEANKWVTPRRGSVQRQSISRQSPVRTSPKVVVVQSPKTSPVPVKRQSRHYYRSSRDNSSSSDETIQVYRKKSKPSAPYRKPYQEHVYVAQMPDVTFPDPSAVDKGKNPSFRKKGKEPQPSTSKDFCGLSCEAPFCTTGFQDVPNSGQQTDIDDLDLLCYPSDKALRNLPLAANDSNSKLRWRIIIKRGDEK